MSRVILDFGQVKQNVATIDGWISEHGASWTVVTKVLAGYTPSTVALLDLGIGSFGDSRLDNFSSLPANSAEKWYLRLPSISCADRTVALTDVSLNSEIEVVRALSSSAQRQGRTHKIMVMVEQGDLREGVLPVDLREFGEAVVSLPNIELTGLGVNSGCLFGVVPQSGQLSLLAHYRDELEAHLGCPVPLVSAGTSEMLARMRSGGVPAEINHFRIGESVFLGTDLVTGGTIAGLVNAATLECEIIELKEKMLLPEVPVTGFSCPFLKLSAEGLSPGQRGCRAIVDIGWVDTDMRGVTPRSGNMQMIGATSDMAVVYVGQGEQGLAVGDTIQFDLSYTALLGLMSSPHVQKELLLPDTQTRRIRSAAPAVLESPALP